MTSNYAFTGVRVAGLSWTSHAAAIAAAAAAPRKRRAAAGMTATSVNRGSI